MTPGKRPHHASIHFVRIGRRWLLAEWWRRLLLLLWLISSRLGGCNNSLACSLVRLPIQLLAVYTTVVYSFAAAAAPCRGLAALCARVRIRIHWSQSTPIDTRARARGYSRNPTVQYSIYVCFTTV